MASPTSHLMTEPRLERMLAFNADRDAIVGETVRRVMDARPSRATSPGDLELVLNDVCFHEDRRLRAARRLDDEDKALKARFARLQRGLRRMPADELSQELRDLATFYARDVVGNFNPLVYAFATGVLPIGLSLLFSKVRLGRSLADLSQLRERILIEGQVADLVRLSRRATLVLVPTHLSNLDSMVVGFAVERAGLPPVTYGAGKNLFTNPLLAFFMRNLGAYRVDRRIQHQLYKDVLKTYSTVILERGYHSLFFPGGTRSRSGAIESRLKLGLAGTALDATVNLLRSGRGRPIYFVPTTLNYQLVLEAATLIEDYLKDAGKNRYIIDDDESTRLGRVSRYFADMLRSESAMTIQFGEPLDVLGHRVSPDGVSHDDRGRPVELRPFLSSGGEVRHDAARDAEYTRELGERIAAAFKAETHVLSTHLVANTLFRRLKHHAGPGADVFRVLRGAEPAEALPLAAIGRAKERLQQLAARGQVRLGARLAESDPATLLDEALRFFALFHTRPVARRQGDGILVEDRALCYYYHNRLTSYGLEEAG